MRTEEGGRAEPRAVLTTARPGLAARYRQVRVFSEELCRPLAVEDYVIQSMPDASPTKWHLAHTSWFFETFVLAAADPGYRSPDPRYGYLFNSYYEAVGERHCRPRRGLLSRPTVEQVREYRRHVDRHVLALLDRLGEGEPPAWAAVVELGLHHEQQHQELLLTDIKHAFHANPLRPAYLSSPLTPAPLPEGERGLPRGRGLPPERGLLRWISYPAALREIGHDGPGFAFDNESPRHHVFVAAFSLGSRLVTNREWLAFIADGGYTRAPLWLSDGWKTVTAQGWQAPLYWENQHGEWQVMTLSGMRAVDPEEPVCHVSHYEADAYAQWAGARLPTEAEWEVAAEECPVDGNFVESGAFHPRPGPDGPAPGLRQMFGDVWEWTRSAYLPYPGYRPLEGALGEYNGKFMSSQMVLRGGSCATARTHIRRTYRNFFPPDARWQFSGVRLARDL
jgi:ergothioneine biosynthesis protein EgtB